MRTSSLAPPAKQGPPRAEKDQRSEPESTGMAGDPGHGFAAGQTVPAGSAARPGREAGAAAVVKPAAGAGYAEPWPPSSSDSASALNARRSSCTRACMQARTAAGSETRQRVGSYSSW